MKTPYFHLSLIVGAFLTSIASAYTPPAGIPNPAGWFGAFDPIETPKPDTKIHCPGWHESAPRANNRTAGDARNAYYIDNTHPSATDSSNTYGSPARPRLTVPNIIYQAGDYIEIHGDGNASAPAKPYTLAMTPRGAGTDTDPIWFVGVNQPVMGKSTGFGAVSTPLVSHMVFDGIHWSGDTSLEIRPRFADNEIRNLTFRNCTMTGTGLASNTTGIRVGASGLTIPTARTSNVLIYNCEISRFGDPAAPGEECGIYQNAFVTNLWVLNCDIHHVAEDGIQGGHSMKRSSTGFYIGNCRIHDNVTNGIDLKQVGSPVVISGCEIRGHWANTPNSTGAGENIVIHYSGSSTPGAEPDVWKNWPEDVTVVGCRLSDADYGIVGSTIDRVRIVGNLINNIRHSLATWTPTSAYSAGTAIQMRGVKDNFQISHNTIHACDNGIQLADNPGVYGSAVKYYRGSVVSNLQKSVFYLCINDNSAAGITGIPPEDTGYWRPLSHQIWGNIIANRSQAAGRDIYLVSSAYGNGAVLMDYNFLFSPLGDSISYGSSSVITLAQLASTHQTMTHGRNTDPGIANADTGDFSIKKGSSAIDFTNEGAAGSPYADFQARFGFDIRRDLLGSTRPIGAAWDAGAIETRTTLTRPQPPKVEILPQ